MSYGMRLWLEGSGCTDTLAMNNEEDVKRLLEGVIRKAGMSLAKGPFCYREEQRDVGKGPGVTGVAILVESSAHIHTYPEQGYFFFELFSCKEFDAEGVAGFVCSFMGCDKVEMQEVTEVGEKFPLAATSL